MKTAFIFSGQGAQATGMMHDIYDASNAAKKVFDIADEALGRSISNLCFYGEQENLNLTHNTQPCMLAAELAAYATLKEKKIYPDAVAGFSLGEYSALVAAGALSMEDAFQIIQVRADAMQEAVPIGQGGMAAVTKLAASEVESLCEEIEGYVIPVNYNCPGQIVVSGEMRAIDSLLEKAKQRKIRCIKLSVSAPFHCDLMKPAAEKLEEAFKSIVFRDTAIPCYSNVDAKPYSDVSYIGKQLCLQAKSPVLWEQTLNNMYNDGIRRFIEIGPGTTLTSFVKKTLKDYSDIELFSVNSIESMKHCIDSITNN